MKNAELERRINDAVVESIGIVESTDLHEKNVSTEELEQTAGKAEELAQQLRRIAGAPDR